MSDLTTVASVEELPLTAVIETRSGSVLEQLDDGWYRPGVQTPYTKVYESWLPAKLMRECEPDPLDGL